MPSVLLVEDNFDNRNIYGTILRHRGYEVLEASDGESGLELARTKTPDLILMDISLPGIDGWTATERLKADEATRSIPVVALTAHALSQDRAKAEALGFNGYLPKPVSPREVVAEVQRHLEIPIQMS